MVAVIIVHGEATHDLDLDLDGDVELLKCLVFSLTEIEPEDQTLTCGGVTLEPNTLLSSLSITEGQRIIVTRTSDRADTVSHESVDVHSVCSHAIFGSAPIRQPAYHGANGKVICVGCAQKLSSSPLRAIKQPPRFVCESSTSQQLLPLADDAKRKAESVLGNLFAAASRESREECQRELQTTAALLGPFAQRVMGAVQQVKQYEDPSLQAKVIPIAQLEQEAAALGTEYPRDNLIKALLAWFKRDFFKWCDAPPCPQNCSGKPQAIGRSPPTPLERQGLAGTVELYQCSTCQTQIRFPRYNHAGVLLDSRQGRCGEWAQCFTLCCRALGIPARFVNDWTDHVWTEVFSEEAGGFVHVDPCENKFNTPLVYETGWSKKLSYVVAASKEEVIDVTWRYTNKSGEVQGRRQHPEATVERFLKAVDALVFDGATLTGDERQQVYARRRKEDTFLSARKPTSQGASTPALTPPVAPAEMEGRVSGAVDWRQARGELGSSPGPIPRHPSPHSLGGAGPPVSAMLGGLIPGDTPLLRSGTNATVPATEALSGKIVGLYFSAHWCPPCRQFTPILSQTYRAVSATRPLEIVFVSSDRSPTAFDEYRSQMPWLALPHSMSGLKAILASRFSVGGIPALIFVDMTKGTVISQDGRRLVATDPGLTSLPWPTENLSLEQSMSKASVSDSAQVSSPTLKMFASGNVDKATMKLEEFSKELSTPCVQLTAMGSALGNPTSSVKLSIINVPKEVDRVLEIWPMEKLFPALDIIRVAVARRDPNPTWAPALSKLLCGHARLSARCMELIANPSAPPSCSLMAIRLATNLLAQRSEHLNPAKCLQSLRSGILSSHAPISPSPLLLAVVSLLFNIGITAPSHLCLDTMCSVVLTSAHVMNAEAMLACWAGINFLAQRTTPTPASKGALDDAAAATREVSGVSSEVATLIDHTLSMKAN